MSESTVNGEDPGMPPPVSGREAIKLVMRGVVRDVVDGFVEVRSRVPGGEMVQEFFAVEKVDEAVAYAGRVGQSADTFVGMGVRSRREGRAEAVNWVWWLWADCDTDESLDRLQTFEPKPSIVVRSGGMTDLGRPKVHAYWPLKTPLSRERVKPVLRALATVLGADMACAEPARVMRLPGTLNFKSDPPRPVELEVRRVTGTMIDSFDVEEIVGEVADEIPPRRDKQVGTPAAPAMSMEQLIDWGLTRVREAGRNSTVFDVFCQARDQGYTEPECEAAIPAIVTRFDPVVTRGHPYTEAEAADSLKQAFGRDSREPWIRDGAIAVPFASIKPKAVEWVISKRVPAGMLTVVAGDPGLGKSMVTVGWAASVSQGSFFLPAAAVLMLSAEDSSATTIRPRLEAAGADLDRVHEIQMCVGGQEVGLVIPDHVADLERLIVEKQAALVVLDPINALIGGRINTWRDSDVRRVLAPLTAMAGRTGAAVVVVMHLTKGNASEAIYRISGSIAYIGQARIAFLLARDPDDPDGDQGNRRVLAQMKSNIGRYAPSLQYEIEEVVLPGGITTARLVEPGESPYSDHDLLDARKTRGDGERKIDQATDLLLDTLGDGQWHPIEPIKAEAKRAGITLSTLERAKRDLRVENNKSNAFPPVHEWRLPPDLHGSPFIKERVAGVAVSDRVDTSTRHGDLDEERP
jgi:hypothetical protein